jgi:D-alanyl-D-alanine carboxypeptidase (penicillin-binding protein 5/6)
MTAPIVPRLPGRAFAIVVRLAGLVVLSFPAAAALPLPDPFPDVAAAYEVRIDGEAVWSHAASAPLAPASLTKLMTALLVAEDGRLDAVATASARAAAATGSRLGLRAGDRYRVGDLLTAALVASANDGCRALAEWRDGSEARFVARMNRRAAALGLRATRFVNACGHDAPGHASSASDLATLTEIAIAQPAIATRVRQARATIRTLDGARATEITNRNALVGRYDGAIGVKTGFTARAGKCVIALAERDGVRVLLVLLNGRDRWWDAHAMLDRAFARRANVARAR